MQGRFKKEGSATGETGPAGPDGSTSSTGRSPGGNAFRGADDTGRANPDPAGHETGATEDREPESFGSRAAVRNWRISTRLVSLIALPVIAATSFGVVRVQDTRQDIEQLDNLQLLTDMTHQATRLASALQEERDRSAGPLVSGEGAKSGNIPELRERTDEARSAFADATVGIDDSEEDLSGISNRVLDIGRQLNQLNTIREEAYADPAYISQTASRYNDLIEALLNLSQDMALATDNSEMIDATRALASFSAAKEYASIQRAMISGGSARLAENGDGFSPSDWRFGKSSQENEQASLRGFERLYGESEVTDPLDGGIANVVSAGQLADRVFEDQQALEGEELSYQDAYDLMRSRVDAMDGIEQVLLDEMESQASSLRADAQRDAILHVALILLVLGTSLIGAFVVARSMVQSLRRLQHTAQEVAHRRLPEVVKQMSEADPQDVNTSVASVGVNSRDEIGKVAQAFDDVHKEAVRLAGEQARLRGNVNAMFTNLSRRTQGLIQRQLSLISELESREADPDQLASLFKLDHLATRMRRNGENLLVLGGEEPGRRWTRPVPLVDVLRAAASEVEQYERIELSAVPKTDVAGRVVNDLVHLLAELLENATSFSSPQTKVKVTGHALPDSRVLVEIHDTGIGLSPEDLAEINDRLANPPTVDVSVSRRMGLFVVGRLSLRHGIRIQLRPSDSGGTTALVMLPAEVAQNAPRPASKQPTPEGLPARQPGASGPATTLSRDTAAADRGGIPGQPERSQMAGTPERPALPSRPTGGVKSQQPAPREPGEPSPSGRPSWADRSDDTGALPPVSGTGTPHDHGLPTRPRAAAQEPQDSVPPGVAYGSARAHGATDPHPPALDSQQAPLGGPQPGPGDTAPMPPVTEGEPSGNSWQQYPRYPQQQTPPDQAAQWPAQEAPQRFPHQGTSGPPGISGPPGPPGQDASTQYQAWQQAPQEPRHPGEAGGLPGSTSGQTGGPVNTPIFEQIESTWFGSRDEPTNQAAPTTDPSETPPPPNPGQSPSLGPETGRSAPPASPGGPVPHPGFLAQHAAPPVAPPPSVGGTAPDAGASGHRAAEEAPPQWRQSPNDERWRQAEQVREPAAGGVTTSGLPRRVPRANLVAGTAQEHEPTQDSGPQVSRAPDDVRGRLTNLRRGIQQGRQAGAPTGDGNRTGPGFSSSYPQER